VTKEQSSVEGINSATQYPLYRKIEDMLRRERLLLQLPSDIEDPPEPSRRVVELGHWHDAIFVGEPVNELSVYKSNASEPLRLTYFDPEGYTDEELVEKVKTYIAFF
jgi:hypothetical protein